MPLEIAVVCCQGTRLFFLEQKVTAPQLCSLHLRRGKRGSNYFGWVTDFCRACLGTPIYINRSLAVFFPAMDFEVN